jgi:threonine synthase
MSFDYTLRCGLCDKEYDSAVIQRLCTCGRPLLAKYRLTGSHSIIDKSLSAPLSNSIWRYRPLLPVKDIKNIICLGEGQTPLLPAHRLGDHLGLRNVFIKDEAVNPSGSFKVRGMSAAISKAVEYGINKFCVPTAGNAGGAAAAYASAAGCKIRVYMPADSGDAFIDECKTYGAEVTTIDGTIVDAGAKMRAECDPEEWFDLSTLKEPYRLEGKKTMGLELYEQFSGNLPEVIIYPTGGGTGLIGMWKAFNELEELGLIDSIRPRLACVQAEGCAPIPKAFAEGREFAEPWPDPQTAALGLRVPSAVGDFLILRAIRETKGEAIAVSEQSWREGVKLLGRFTGIYACPEGGAVVAALLRLLINEKVDPSDGIVLFNTGTGFKYQHVL